MLYGPLYKDVSHELLGDGIMSAIVSVHIQNIEAPVGVPRTVLTLNGKWLQYKKFYRLKIASSRCYVTNSVLRS